MAKAERKGFSMLELIFTVGLMGMSAGLFMLSGGTRLKARPGADALAEALANELGQARLLAMRQLSPVAVMFPSDGNRPHSSSLYQLEGLTHPHVSRSHNFAGDFPGFSLFLGNWSGLETQAPLVVGTKWADFDVLEWLPDDREKDCALVFMPDGTVRGTRAGAGLSQFNGEYHIAVSAGISYSGDTLNGAGETNTVCINGGGAIRVESGLAGSTLKTTGTMPNSNTPSAPVAQTYVGHALGSPQGNSSLPEPDGAEPTTIAPDGFATVTAFAVDQNQSGERLFLRWDVVAPAGRDKGVFSIALDPNRGSAMDFNPKATTLAGSTAAIRPAYQSSYQWRPPANAQPLDLFRLKLMIQNQDTGVWEEVAIKDVVIAPYGSVLFEHSKPGERALYRMQANGTGKKRFQVSPATRAQPLNYREFCPAASPDGNRIVFLSDDRPGVPTGCQDIFLTDREGLTCTQVTQGLYCEAPCLSPDGSHVAFKRFIAGSPDRYELCVVPVAPMTRATDPITSLNTGGPPNTVLHGFRTAPASPPSPTPPNYLSHVYREDRLCWVRGATRDKIYFTKTILGHTGTPPSGISRTGNHPFVFEVEMNRDGTQFSGPSESFAGSFHYGSWSPAWSPFSHDIYRPVDGSDFEGDPFIKLNPPGWSLAALGSPGFHDSQPTPYLVGPGPNTEALLIVRSPAGDAGNFHRICRLPRGATNDSQIVSITQDLSTSNCTWPVYLR